VDAIADMVSVSWRLTTVTIAGIGLVLGTAVAVDSVGLPQPVSALAPVAVGVVVGYAISRRFGDGE
jgi:hypothetical protein